MNDNTYSPKPKTTTENRAESNEGLDFHKVVQICASNWAIFLVSIILSLGLGLAYILHQTPQYTRRASVLIADQDQNSISKSFSQFSGMGAMRNWTNIHNEMLVFKSPAYMQDVVKTLHLEMEYWVEGRFHDVPLYGTKLPIQISLLDIQPDEFSSLDAKLVENGNVVLSNFTNNNGESDTKALKAKIGTVVQTPLGKVLVNPTQTYDGSTWERPIHVYHNPLSDVTNRYSSAILVSQSDERSSVIDLRIDDGSPERATDILATLLNVYDKKWVDNINEQANNTAKFIDEELSKIENELNGVDASISSYKSSTMVPDIEAAGGIYLNRAETNRSEMMELNNQLFMANYMKKQLSSDLSKNKTLPANSGIESPAVSQQIILYNEKVVQRNSLLANSGANNPIIIDIEQELALMRQSILAALDNTIAQLNNKLSNLKGSESQTNRQLASNPTQAKDLLSVERQQKVKEQLYLFLLQKKEDNNMSKAFTAFNSKILTPPFGSARPTSPVKLNILLIAFLLGLIIPLVLLLIRHSWDNLIHNKKDLESLSLPFLGEIPLSYRKHKGLMAIFNRKREVREIVVKERSGNAINEAFRVLRSNIEFMLAYNDESKVVMLTSAYAGSGKTFISANVSTSFAIKGKKTLLIDLDLRKATVSQFVNSVSPGLSDYLSGHVKDVKDVIVKGTINPNLDVIPVGTNPPNPTELLFTEKFNNLFDLLGNEYEYIFIDCPPIDVVADASIINKFCDLTIFVVRAGLFEKTMLPELERNYTENRYKNMTLLLNGTYDEFNGYGYHSYGYGYGANKD